MWLDEKEAPQHTLYAVIRRAICCQIVVQTTFIQVSWIAPVS